MKGIAIIQNGITTIAPYTQSVISFYEERNMLIRGTRNEQKEFATIRTATPDEVKEHLLPEVVASTAGVMPAVLQSSTTSEMDQLRAIFVAQQAQIADLQARLSEVAKPQSLADNITPTPDTNTAPAINIKKKDKQSPEPVVIPDSLDKLITDGTFQEIV